LAVTISAKAALATEQQRRETENAHTGSMPLETRPAPGAKDPAAERAGRVE
jgi:hypothetical protein